MLSDLLHSKCFPPYRCRQSKHLITGQTATHNRHLVYHNRVQRQSNLSSQSISFIKTRIPGRLQAQLMRNSFSFMKNRKLIIRLSILLLPHTVSPFMNISGLSVSRFSLAQCITCAIVKLALGDRGTSASTDFLFPNNNSIPPLQISKHELHYY